MKNALKQRTYEETVGNLQPLKAEDLGLIDGSFIVKRGPNQDVAENGGWYVSGKDAQGFVVIENYNRTAAKTVKPELLINWQQVENENNFELKKLEVVITDIGSNAVGQVVERPLEMESPYEEHLRALFAPVLSDGTQEDEDDPFDDFFTLNDEDFNKRQNERMQRDILRRSIPTNSREEIKPQNIEYSVGLLPTAIQNNPKINILLKEFLSEPSDLSQQVNLIRENTELRLKLGKYFLDKINQIAHTLPERVKSNTQKNPNHMGYGNFITSREYVALLCLSKLDGTFDNASTSGDPIEILGNGEIRGQHRLASEYVLFS